MKKFFLLSAIFVCSATAIPCMASDEENPEMVITSTYYGSEASTNANNPCKGATTRVCAILNYTLRQVSSMTDITCEVYDADMNPLHKESHRVPATITEVYTNLLEELPDNAIMEKDKN